jgi:prepilin-type N-terminal cleavage/methylation domain-containing protein/prepilin-type processing-associated H-X9-DG protein
MRRNHRSGFTLIELLVVIAIIAILAAILFPVFAQAREKARQSACISNVKQMGLAAVMYAQDYDEIYPGMWQWNPGGIQAHSPYLYPPGFDLKVAEQVCQTCPYVKNAQVYSCPSRGGNIYSYGYAYPTMWGGYPLIPNSAYGFPTGPSMADFSHPADTVMIMDSGKWAGDDVCNALTWEGIHNIGCGNNPGYNYPYVYQPLTNQWSAPLPLHNETTTVAFVDGHVKSIRPEAMVSPVNMFLRQRP